MADAQQSDVQYLTKDGDVLDLICWNYYGRTQNVVEVVLLHNAELLSKYSAILPAGLILALPVVNVEVAQSFKLWDYRNAVAFTERTNMADTIAKVLSDLAAYRASHPQSSVTRDVVRIGNLRIRDTGTSTVMEVLGSDDNWKVQQEFTPQA